MRKFYAKVTRFATLDGRNSNSATIPKPATRLEPGLRNRPALRKIDEVKTP
jgi:hypothetical protein